MSEFGKLNLYTSLYPMVSSPLDARTYFENLDDAIEAAKIAVEVGETGIYHYGMQVLVKDGNDGGEKFVWYAIKKGGTGGTGGTLVAVADRIVNKPITVGSEEEMNDKLSSATIYDIGKIYKYEGNTGLYEYGALYILTNEVLDGDNVRYW